VIVDGFTAVCNYNYSGLEARVALILAGHLLRERAVRQTSASEDVAHL
jgi:hypothetical protein